MKRWSSAFGDFNVDAGELGIVRVAEPNGTQYPDLEPELAASFDSHVAGKPVSMRLDLHGLAPFRQITLAKVLEIPYGEVRSYSWVAREIGRPAAIRAVATAVARNPVPLLIPCHRVVRSSGVIGEYSLVGPALKREILTTEGLVLARLEDLAKRSIRYLGDMKEQMFHVATCRLAPLVDHETYVELASLKAAEDLFFKPCRRCRPVHVY